MSFWSAAKHFYHQPFSPFMSAAHFARKDLPGPGSGNLAFLNLALQEQTPIGAGMANERQLLNSQPVTYVPHLVGVQGIGGLISGQVRGAPLIVRSQ